MKIIIWIFTLWASANILALICNLLFANPITATLTFISIFATGTWLIKKGIEY